MELKRRVVRGLGTTAFVALFEILFLGANHIKVASSLNFATNVWRTPVWSLIVFPLILGVLTFSGFWD